MRNLVALIAGALFSTGLILSGMTNTQKVQGFLDVFGAWDPTLIFVMGGATIPMMIAWFVTRRMRQPVFATYFPSDILEGIDTRLVVGSILFGLGWGIAGFCPGPAMASLSFGGMSSIYFFSAMAAGMIAYPFIRRAIF